MISDRQVVRLSEFKKIKTINDWEFIHHIYGEDELKLAKFKTGVKFDAWVLYPNGIIKKHKLVVYTRTGTWYDHGHSGNTQSQCLKFIEYVNGYDYSCYLDKNTDLKFYVPDFKDLVEKGKSNE